MEVRTNESVSPLGVMQGRLLPKYMNRYQAHPLGYWQEEFQLASNFGLSCIEFILDYNNSELNPLMSLKGIDEILSLKESTGVSVQSVCADYFMEAPIHSPDSTMAERSVETLRTLILNGKKLGLSDIVIPCVDKSSLVGVDAQYLLIRNIKPLLHLAEEANINLALETDLAPEPFAELLHAFGSDRVTVNYDTGNSASLGYDPIEEFEYYGNRISDIHIKDRQLGGGSVILGTGNTQFSRFFEALSSRDYKGPFIMQAFRDDEGLSVFKSQLSWIREKYLRL